MIWHGIVGAVGAKITDQVTQSLPRHDQLGADQQDKGKRQGRANAVEHLRQRARHHHVPEHGLTIAMPADLKCGRDADG